MSITPRVGLPGQFFDQNTGAEHAAQVDVVHSATLVDVVSKGGTVTSIAYVDVGGTPPASPAKYFQAVDYTAP